MILERGRHRRIWLRRLHLCQSILVFDKIITISLTLLGFLRLIILVDVQIILDMVDVFERRFLINNLMRLPRDIWSTSKFLRLLSFLEESWGRAKHVNLVFDVEEHLNGLLLLLLLLLLKHLWFQIHLKIIWLRNLISWNLFLRISILLFIIDLFSGSVSLLILHLNFRNRVELLIDNFHMVLRAINILNPSFCTWWPNNFAPRKLILLLLICVLFHLLLILKNSFRP